VKSSECSWALISDQQLGDTRSSCGTSLCSQLVRFSLGTALKHVTVQDRRPNHPRAVGKATLKRLKLIDVAVVRRYDGTAADSFSNCQL